MTDFRQDKAIYLQMADRLCDGILAGRYSPGGRIPSVRELSEMMEVNTNTVVRAYDLLTRHGIVYTRRGMGYFVSDNAPEMIKADRRRQFMEEKLPEMFRQMRMLDIPIDTVDRMWEELTR
ncbi:MAG: GntR family transcriptional regulator [Bacteroidetes bacterium]|uniref:GntR family transcriptional regulator n=1 Tax=Candidatus Cryptobacteroides faecavium TaxID=2840762 RepID=A0A9D9II14_9BACT|nr:GntR family transcriptional regulator [Candidatus Cryptobacteroides faecavium]